MITTGEVAENIGSDDAEKLIADVKQKVAEDNLSSAEDIGNAIDESARDLNISLSDADKEKIQSLMDKISDLDLNVSQLKEQAKKQVSEKKGITISTLHSIKGLEFDAVFLMDVNEGSLPYHKAVTESSIEEERRLFYVGITRARKFLWILYAKNRHDKELEVSRFLTESGLVLKEEKDKKK